MGRTGRCFSQQRTMRHMCGKALVRSSLLWLAAVACGGGCGRKPDGIPADAQPETSAQEATRRSAEAPVAITPPKAFEPPAIEALDRDAKWIDRPVRDGLQRLREEQAKETPQMGVPVALEMRNDSAEANALILSALGRLPDAGQADLGARVDRHVTADLGSTNPIMISTSAEFDILGLTGFGLFSFDRALEPFATADTVSSWQTSADGMFDKVVLRDDLQWSDGQPITAHDIAFTYRVIMDPRVPVPAVRSGTDQLAWVHAYDDRTVIFFHKEPLATNVWNINFPVLPQHIYADTWEQDPTLKDSPAHLKLEEKPVCGGPYEIVERTRGQQIVLRRRANWSTVGGSVVREEPFFKEIRFRIIEDPNTTLLALKAGEIDEMILLPEQWTTQTKGEDFSRRNTKVTAPEWVSFHFGWNLDTPFFADRRVRRAMSYAFDHDRMLEQLCYGLYQPAAGNFHESSWMAPRKKLAPYKQDLDRAKRAEKYARIQEILYEDQPYTWLYWRNSFYGFSKQLRGYVFSPRGPYHYSPGFSSLWKPREE